MCVVGVFLCVCVYLVCVCVLVCAVCFCVYVYVVCVLLCVCSVCVLCVCMCMFLCVDFCESPGLVLVVFLKRSPPYFLDSVFLLTLKLPILAWLAGQRALGTPVSASPALESFMWVLGIQTQIFMPMRQALHLFLEAFKILSNCLTSAMSDR